MSLTPLVTLSGAHRSWSPLPNITPQVIAPEPHPASQLFGPRSLDLPADTPSLLLLTPSQSTIPLLGLGGDIHPRREGRDVAIGVFYDEDEHIKANTSDGHDGTSHRKDSSLYNDLFCISACLLSIGPAYSTTPVPQSSIHLPPIHRACHAMPCLLYLGFTCLPCPVTPNHH